MSVARCSAREFSTTPRTVGLGCRSRLFTLMPEQVAEGRKLTAVTAVFPALGLFFLDGRSCRAAAGARHAVGSLKCLWLWWIAVLWKHSIRQSR